MNIRRKFEKALLLVLVFLIPTQLALHFWPSYSFVFGIRIDYLSPAIYLTDILILLLLIFNFKLLFNFILKYKKWLTVLFILIFVNIASSTQVYISLFKWLKLIEMFVFGVYICLRKDIFKTETVQKTLFYSAIFFSLIGIAQFILGRTIGGLFYLLGERSFSILTPGIALVKIQGMDFLRAYSTFPHPNALAGFLGVLIIFLWSDNFFRKNTTHFLGLFIIFICLVLTFSFSSISSILIIMVWKVLNLNKKGLLATVLLLSLLMPFFSEQTLNLEKKLSDNVFQRLELSVYSGKMISERFMTGEGLNTFIVNMPRLKGFTGYLWYLQPVHNIFLLVFSETGILGILIFSYLIFKFVKKPKLGLVVLFIVLTGFTDHYWLTIQQNVFLLSLLVSLS